MLAVFLDQETTGLDPKKHTVLEIALRIYHVETDVEIAAYEAIIKLSEQEWAQRNLFSVEINGFTWDQVAEGKTIELVKQEIIALFSEVGVIRGNAVFICQNPAFDRGFFSHIIDVDTHEQLNWPYHWLDLASMYWLIRMREARVEQREYPNESHLSKDQIAKNYDIPPEKRPHRAMNGVNHLIDCYHAVLLQNSR